MRVVTYNAKTQSTHLLFYTPSTQGSESNTLEACYVLHNDTSLRYGLLHPYDTFSQHSVFKVRPVRSAAARGRTAALLGCARRARTARECVLPAGGV